MIAIGSLRIATTGDNSSNKNANLKLIQKNCVSSEDTQSDDVTHVTASKQEPDSSTRHQINR
ncbi:hypothetical protein OUZ56_009487 [Daphnia magna]|uniref:Uncharacterized protein n=1 Tax=Daphnia magna TaxID=35525 RepID=A0ABR0AG48_9CRUS|nr:hypothetical protein OUZ56_009487 [Daphnia magna]